MGFREADRGQAIQVGAILLFGIAILLLSVYQATVVPQQNARVEFNAYQQATDDMLSVRDGVLTAATEGTPASATVQTGATYPPRTIFVNPGTPTGSLATAETEPVDLDGVEAVASEPENVRRFWNTTDGTYPTAQLTFSPAYNEFDAPPVVLSGRSVYRTPESALVPISAETFVSGNRITIVTLRGDLATAGVSTAVTAEPVSAATRTVVVTGTGDTFDVTVPTPGPATAWNESVAPDVVANPNVITTTPNGNETVTVTFNGSRRYELRLAAVELRARSDASTVTRPGPTYVVPVTANGTAVSERPTPVTVEVRDRYDNPVSGTEVNLTLIEGSGQFLRGGTSRVVATDGEGRATVALSSATNYRGNLTVRAQGDFDGDGTVEPIERTHVGLAVAGGGEGRPPINEETGGVSLGVSAVGGTGQDDDLVDVTFNNTADEVRRITDARVAFYYVSGSGTTGQTQAPTEWRFHDPDQGPTYTVGEPERPVTPPVELAANDETTVTLEFPDLGTDAQNDFFIFEVRYEDVGRATYYIYVSGGGGGGGGGAGRN